MNSRDKQRLKIIILRLLKGHTAWFKRQSIYVGKKETCWMLNYLQDDRTKFNRLVRGIVIRKPEPNWSGDPLSLIQSFPFTRFFNLGEKDAASIDFQNAEMLEKLDGAMVGVFFPNCHTAPEWHTRKLVSTNPYDRNLVIETFNGKKFNLLETIGQYVRELEPTIVDINYTYIFEFLHESTQIVTRYTPEKYGLYLLAGRSNLTHKELSEEELDIVADRLRCGRPRRWDSAKDYPKIDALFKEMNEVTPNFEGFIFRDKSTGNRVKVKSKDYLVRHHLLDSLSYKNLLPLVLKGEVEEVVAYFPHTIDRIKEIQDVCKTFLNEVLLTVLQYKKDFTDRKALAVALNSQKINSERDAFIKDCVFSGFKLTPEKIPSIIENKYKLLAVGEGKQAGQAKKALNILGLIDDEVNTGEL